MGWGAVWQAAAAQFGAEPVEFRIVAILVAAFAILMILIGLGHAFRSAGPKDSAPAPAPDLPKRVFAAAPPPPAAPVPLPKPAQPVPVFKPVPRKTAKTAINRQRTLRPQIRRAP